MKNKLTIHNSEWIKDKIYTVCGEQVMLDFELAEIYGYETKAFNQQVKNNIERFDEDFRFQLTVEEFNEILRCKNSASNEILRSKNLTSKTENRGGRRYMPYAFTEQGIYMLMTVLKGELAVAQSKILIRMFKEMKHFLQNNANIFAEINTIKQNLLETNVHQKKHCITSAHPSKIWARNALRLNYWSRHLFRQFCRMCDCHTDLILLT